MILFLKAVSLVSQPFLSSIDLYIPIDVYMLLTCIFYCCAYANQSIVVMIPFTEFRLILKDFFLQSLDVLLQPVGFGLLTFDLQFVDESSVEDDLFLAFINA